MTKPNRYSVHGKSPFDQIINPSKETRIMTPSYKECNDVIIAWKHGNVILRKSAADKKFNLDDIASNLQEIIAFIPLIKDAVLFENKFIFAEVLEEERKLFIVETLNCLFETIEIIRDFQGIAPVSSPGTALDLGEILDLGEKLAKIMDDVSADGELRLTDLFPMFLQVGEVTDLVKRAVKFNQPLEILGLSGPER